MSSSNCHSPNTNSQIRRQSVSSIASDGEEDFIDDDDDDDDGDHLNDRSMESIEKNQSKSKKTLGRVKIKMAYIDNKIRRYTTFSKRKTGIMKKAYELATLTGTEVMLLVASETGHVYTYATPKLQPMITSETGKALIQTCLAKDEPPIEPMVDTPTSPPAATTTLNNNDVIFIDDNQRKKRTNASIDSQSTHVSNFNRPLKRAKLKSSDELSSRSLNKSKSMDISKPSVHSVPSPSTTYTVPLPCFIPSDSQQNHISIPPSYTIDLNALKSNGMNIAFAPQISNSPEHTSISSNSPFVFTLGNLSYQSS